MSLYFICMFLFLFYAILLCAGLRLVMAGFCATQISLVCVVCMFCATQLSLVCVVCMFCATQLSLVCVVCMFCATQLSLVYVVCMLPIKVRVTLEGVAKFRPF